MAGFIDAAVQDIDNRLKELREEEQKLVAARAALTAGAKRGPGRPPRTETAAPAAQVVPVAAVAATHAPCRHLSWFALSPASRFRRSPSRSRLNRITCTA
jgi:hypothetical protein